MVPGCDAYWILVLLLAGTGAVGCAVHRPGAAMLSVGLFVSGVASVLLLTEVQQRYRSIFAPALALMAGYRVTGLASCVCWSREALASAVVRLRPRWTRRGRESTRDSATRSPDPRPAEPEVDG